MPGHARQGQLAVPGIGQGSKTHLRESVRETETAPVPYSGNSGLGKKLAVAGIVLAKCRPKNNNAYILIAPVAHGLAVSAQATQ